jgi:predicted transcriptional regulator
MSKTNGKHPGGRPTKYNAQYHPLLGEALARNGLINEEIAKKLEVSTSTVSKWIQEHKEFSDAITRGRNEPDDQVEQALFKKAIGFEKEAVKIFMPSNADEPVYAPYQEYFAPDTAAAFIWLKNRRPEKWRDRHEFTGADGAPLNFTVSFVKPKDADPDK